MGNKRKRHWLWNLLILITVITCVLAFTAHYKNWTKIGPDHIKILSGVYYVELPFADLDSIDMVVKIPSMERINGFSVKAIEKGIFTDSLTNTKTYVYVDDLRQDKIRLVYRDSLKLYLNFTDSIQTRTLYDFLGDKINASPE
ncbi:hypothetical protein [Spongiimicrobium sp. 2-473A-2-J]|uniref:hypothetical protein n=1 Tax=Eudoraea algarum TaxID=3417568 RepID=UPI003D35ABF0